VNGNTRRLQYSTISVKLSIASFTCLSEADHPGLTTRRGLRPTPARIAFSLCLPILKRVQGGPESTNSLWVRGHPDDRRGLPAQLSNNPLIEGDSTG